MSQVMTAKTILGSQYKIISTKEQEHIVKCIFCHQTCSTDLVPSRRVLSPGNTERISLPNDAGFMGSSLLS
jgi:hypothetical protein